jgi:membrane-associated protein
VTSIVVALPQLMDPMYWLGNGGPFASAVLPGVMLIVFLETGLLFPFLPGDTLLFTAGLLAAQPNAPVGVWTLAPCAAAAAIVGGQVGYLIGRRLGPALFKKEDARFFKKHYLTSSHEFFERHGRKTIVIGHFVGVVRSFTPLIAGASGMRYPVFLAYDVIGAVGWGVGLVVVGYHLGGIPFVGAHLELMVLAIACLSILPVAVSAARALLTRRGAASTDEGAPPAELTAGPTSAT